MKLELGVVGVLLAANLTVGLIDKAVQKIEEGEKVKASKILSSPHPAVEASPKMEVETGSKTSSNLTKKKAKHSILIEVNKGEI